MPYMDIVTTHARNNRFEYDHKAIYKQVRKAMKKQGEERDRALKEVFTSEYKKEGARYEALRQQLTTNVNSMPNANQAARLVDQMKTMAIPARFLEQMTEIVGEMAKDIDPSYKPQVMLGLSATDAKNLVSAQLSSYTRLDESMYSLNHFGWEDAHREIRIILRDRETGEIRNFANAFEEHKVAMYEVYVRKEALKKQLKDNGFFWRLFHRTEVRDMRHYIDSAEATLAAVQFPKEAIGEANAEFAFAAASEADYLASHMYFDEKFAALANAKEEKLEEKSLENTEFEKVFDEKSFDEEKLEDILDQRAAHEDQMIENIIKRENQKRLEAQQKEAQQMASIKKPTNIAEVKRAFANKETTKFITNKFVSLMANASNTNANKETKASSVHKTLGMAIGEAWTDQKNMHSHAIKFFKTAYNAIKNDTPGMSVAEKLVAAQRMTDIMMNIYSPVATNPSLAQYGENYAVQKLYNDNIKELTGFEGNVNELMNSVKVKLGIGKEKVDFGNEFGEAVNDKSAKVEDLKAPVVENVKQP